MRPYPHKTLSLTVPVIYSLFLHAAALSFALTTPIFKGNAHIKSYIVHLERGQEEEKVSTAERLAGKEERVRRMATVKALTKKKSREAAWRALQEKQKETKSEKAHWPKRRVAKKKIPRQEVQTPMVAKRMHSAEKRLKPEVVPGKEDSTRKMLNKDESLQKARRTEAAVPQPPKPEEEARVEKEDAAAESFEKPGWQELVSEEKKTEEAKERESALKNVNALDENSDEPFAKDKALSTKEEKAIEEIMSGMMTGNERLSIDGAEAGIPDLVNPTGELCDGCELVSMLYENPAEQMIRGVWQEEDNPPEPATVEAGALSEYSPVDGLCDGCSLLSLLHVNPIEELMYALMYDEKSLPVTEVEEEPIGPLSVLDELCPGCDILSTIFKNITAEIFTEPLPDEAFAGIAYEVTELPFVVTAIESQAETVSEPIVIEVSEAELEAAERNAEAERRETRAIRDSDAHVSQVAEILTPRENRVPTKGEYLNILKIAAADEPEKSEVLVASEAEIGLPIYVRRDIEIKVFFSGDESGTSFRFIKKTHPMDGEKYVETDITETLDEIVLTGGSGLRRMFSLARAGKGAYSFIMESSSANIDGIAVKFLFNKGLKSEKPKEYTGIEVVPGSVVEIKFLLPEAVFWDDEDYFTGAVESPRFTTKFNDETGLIWKERTAR
jgi:hypothetical protein